MTDITTLRARLVDVALDWERAFGNAPAITSVVSEYDAARLVGMTDEEYSAAMRGRTAVQRGDDFVYRGVRYQVKANRPSGKPGSPVTIVGKANNYDWDILIWVLYDRHYEVQEAWRWEREAYINAFDAKTRLSPADYRRGTRLLPSGMPTATAPVADSGAASDRSAPSPVTISAHAPEAVAIRECAILITINQLYRPGMTAEELYEATRGVWKVGPRREGAELAFAVYQGVVREVYRVRRWHPAATTPYRTRPDVPGYRGSGRWEFDGEVAHDVRDAYVGLDVGKSGQNPIRYVNM